GAQGAALQLGQLGIDGLELAADVNDHAAAAGAQSLAQPVQAGKGKLRKELGPQNLAGAAGVGDGDELRPRLDLGQTEGDEPIGDQVQHLVGVFRLLAQFLI